MDGYLCWFLVDTPDADSKPGELLVKYSKRPEMASVFNYASMAHNNHFFFNCLVSGSNSNLRSCL
jgi:Fe-Mn family superoxide dismutase